MRLATLLLVLATPALAATPPVWKVDPGKSTLGFSGVQTGTRFSGKFTRFDASIVFDPAHPDAARSAPEPSAEDDIKNLMTKQKTLDLVKAFYAIEDEKKRNSALVLLKTMGELKSGKQ